MIVKYKTPKEITEKYFSGEFFVQWSSPIENDDSQVILKVKNTKQDCDYEVVQVYKIIKGNFHPTAKSKEKIFVDKDFCLIIAPEA